MDKWDEKEKLHHHFDEEMPKKYQSQTKKLNKKYHPQHTCSFYFNTNKTNVEDIDKNKLSICLIYCKCGFFKIIKPWWKFW